VLPKEQSLPLPPVKGNTYTVVIDPVLVVFCPRSLGHLSEADMTYENPDLLEVMSIRRQFGPEITKFFDGGATRGHRGSYFSTTTKAPHRYPTD